MRVDRNWLQRHDGKQKNNGEACEQDINAISFGVFWRSAPSTRAIILSMKVSPGLEVTRILIWSESTRVPPVTAERSPPDSRMTGADSPVMADSSTEVSRQ